MPMPSDRFFNLSINDINREYRKAIDNERFHSVSLIFSRNWIKSRNFVDFYLEKVKKIISLIFDRETGKSKRL